MADSYSFLSLFTDTSICRISYCHIYRIKSATILCFSLQFPPATILHKTKLIKRKRQSHSFICKRQILRLPLNLTPLLWAAWFPAFLGKLLCPGHQMVQFCRIYISFFVTILRQLREDMPEVVVWAQIVQLCCFWNTVNKSAGSGTFCCVMEHPVLLADTESPDSPFGSGVIDWDIPIGQKYL